MSAVHQPWWFRYSERAFAFNFIAFSFVMFSCWFPTGFSATFSTFAFLSALPLFLSRVDFINISLFEKAGLALFAWLFLSVLWSEAAVWDSLVYLSEYRLYFMIPVFAAALLGMPSTQKWAFYAAVSGAVIALITSYGLSLGWWKIEGANLSLANSIYHGFIMSFLLLVTLLVSRGSSGLLRIGAIAVAVLTAYNVLNIETGRTGYLQVIAVSFILIALSLSRLRAIISILVALIFLGVAYLALDQFNNRVNETLANVGRVMANEDYASSSWQRVEFYRGAIQIGADNPLLGVGVGDVVTELESRTNSGQLRFATDNVHSEFMNMLIAGGVPALLLFFAFVSLIAWAGFHHRKTNRAVGDTLIGVSVIIFVSALFNSTVKDYGEKHALLIILSLLVANRALSDKNRPKAAPGNLLKY